MKNRFMRYKNFNKSYLFFLPLLVIYILLVILFSQNNFVHDEARYIEFAKNLTHGHYSPTNQIKLTNGPGYPLLLFPFVAAHTPIIFLKLLNAFLLFFSVILFYLTIIQYLKSSLAIFFAYLLGLYPPVLRHLLLIQPEVFVYFLFCSFIFILFNTKSNDSLEIKPILKLSAILTMIILTRVLFGWVALTGLVFYFILYLFKKNKLFKSYALIFLLSLLFCVPYLVYTYSLTGKIFYWSTNAGGVLYWMTSPYPGEYGNYPNENISKKILFKKGSPHYKYRQQLQNITSEFDRDNARMEKALSNLKKYPLNYLKNWMSNIARLVFNIPNSFEFEHPKKFIYIIPNSILLYLLILTVYPLVKGRKNAHQNVYLLVFIFLVYLGGSSLLTAGASYSIVIIPLLYFQIIFVFTQLINIRFSLV